VVGCTVVTATVDEDCCATVDDDWFADAGWAASHTPHPGAFVNVVVRTSFSFPGMISQSYSIVLGRHCAVVAFRTQHDPLISGALHRPPHPGPLVNVLLSMNSPFENC
jgi:hypothetical protein